MRRYTGGYRGFTILEVILTVLMGALLMYGSAVGTMLFQKSQISAQRSIQRDFDYLAAQKYFFKICAGAAYFTIHDPDSSGKYLTLKVYNNMGALSAIYTTGSNKLFSSVTPLFQGLYSKTGDSRYNTVRITFTTSGGDAKDYTNSIIVKGNADLYIAPSSTWAYKMDSAWKTSNGVPCTMHIDYQQVVNSSDKDGFIFLNYYSTSADELGRYPPYGMTLMKLDNAGTRVWHKKYTVSDRELVPNKIIVTKNSSGIPTGYAVIGTVNANTGTQANNYITHKNIFIMLTDLDGNILNGTTTAPPASYDVNRDGSVTAMDIMVLVNYINANGPTVKPSSSSDPAYYYDVNSDGYITATDEIILINAVNAMSNAGLCFYTYGDGQISYFPYGIRQVFLNNQPDGFIITGASQTSNSYSATVDRGFTFGKCVAIRTDRYGKKTWFKKYSIVPSGSAFNTANARFSDSLQKGDSSQGYYLSGIVYGSTATAGTYKHALCGLSISELGDLVPASGKIYWSNDYNSPWYYYYTSAYNLVGSPTINPVLSANGSQSGSYVISMNAMNSAFGFGAQSGSVMLNADGSVGWARFFVAKGNPSFGVGSEGPLMGYSQRLSDNRYMYTFVNGNDASLVIGNLDLGPGFITTDANGQDVRTFFMRTTIGSRCIKEVVNVIGGPDGFIGAGTFSSNDGITSLFGNEPDAVYKTDLFYGCPQAANPPILPGSVTVSNIAVTLPPAAYSQDGDDIQVPGSIISYNPERVSNDDIYGLYLTDTSNNVAIHH